MERFSRKRDSRQDARSSIEEAIARGLRLVDDRTGIIQGLYDLPLETNDPRLFHVSAPLADTSRYFGMECYRHNGGAALSRERATIAAIGEAVERYCGGFYDPDALIVARPKDLGDNAIDPGQFTLFADEQYSQVGFPMSRPSKDTFFSWASGYSLVRNVQVYVPACFVYVPYRFPSREEFITLPISTGLACGSSREDAILRGIYEAVERDSFAITWLNQIPMPRVTIGSATSGELGAVVQRFEEAGLGICVNLATTDLGIPVVITLSLDDSGAGPASVIAARADFDIEYAIMRSLEETAQTRLWGRKLLRDWPEFSAKDGYTNIVEGGDHVRLYADRHMVQHLQFLTGAPSVSSLEALPTVAQESVSDRIRRCVDALSAKGHDVIVVDVTTSDMAEVGFHVVRVLVPGLHPLDMDHNYRYLGGKRLYQVPVTMGYSDRMRTQAELNPVPHPFP